MGTNPDGSFPTPDGPAPGAGAIVRAVEVATEVEPIIVGKPEPLMFEMALEDVPDDARAVVMGDNPDTDVLGAHRTGLPGILVADDEPDCRPAADRGRPDGHISGLGRRLLAALEEQARARGVGKVRLETNRRLTEAIRLYRSAGYEEVEPFNDEPYAHHWFEKRLDPVPDEPT